MLTEEEKVRIRHHLGYINVKTAEVFSLGVPAGVETQFLIEGAMNRVLETAEPKVRQLLGVLDQIEAQQIGDLELLAVEKIDEITINPREQAQLDQQYHKWRNALANLLGTYPNPFDKRFENGGINVPIRY